MQNEAQKAHELLNQLIKIENKGLVENVLCELMLSNKLSFLNVIQSYMQYLNRINAQLKGQMTDAYGRMTAVLLDPSNKKYQQDALNHLRKYAKDNVNVEFLEKELEKEAT